MAAEELLAVTAFLDHVFHQPLAVESLAGGTRQPVKRVQRVRVLRGVIGCAAVRWRRLNRLAVAPAGIPCLAPRLLHCQPVGQRQID